MLEKNLLKIYFILSTFFISLTVGRRKFTVGAIFENPNSEYEIAFRAAIERVNVDERKFELLPIIKYSSYEDSFVLESIVCELISDGVIAIFDEGSPETDIVSTVCHTLNIPHIMFDMKVETRDSERSFHSMDINVHPNLLVLAKAYAAVVKSLSWERFVILYETEQELIQMQDVLQIHSPKNKPIVVRHLGEGPDYRPILKNIREMKIPYMILHCKPETVLPVFRQAHELKMLGEYQSILLPSLDAHTLDYTGEDLAKADANVTTVKIIDPSNFDLKNIVYAWEQLEKRDGRYYRVLPNQAKTNMLLVNDAVMVFAKGFAELNNFDDIQPKSIDCTKSKSWVFGKRIIHQIRGKQFEGSTGRIDIDSYGQRDYFTMQSMELAFGGIFYEVLSWNPVDEIQIIQTDSSAKILEEKIASKLFIVSSRIGEPFLFNRSDWITDPLEGNARYEGFSMDLIEEIAKFVGFKYRFELAKDNNYGSPHEVTGQWDGIVRQVMDGKADMGICDLTITSTRRFVVDFTPPFMNLGISLIYIKPEVVPPSYWSFTDPFSAEVWIKMGLAFICIVIVVFIVGRLAAIEEWESPHPCKSDNGEVENPWIIINCFWLTFGSLMGQGSDVLPKSSSLRVVTGMWWFFALMLLNSYVANLAAFLTKSNESSTIKSVAELAGQNKIKYGTVKDGSTMGFFRDSNDSLYQKMWSFMETQDPSVFTKNNDVGEERIMKSKRLYAFFMESSVIEYKIERNCELVQVGVPLDSKSYGIAMPFNSPYRKQISEAILKLGESGVLTDLKRRWWKERHGGGKCKIETVTIPTAAKLGVENVRGVFLVFNVGIAISYIIGFIEFFWHVQSVAVEEKISMSEAFKSEMLFVLKFWITTKPVRGTSRSLSSSKKSLKSITTDTHSVNEKTRKASRFSEFSLKSFKSFNFFKRGEKRINNIENDNEETEYNTDELKEKRKVTRRKSNQSGKSQLNIP